MKQIKDYFYSLDEETSDLEIFITDLSGSTFSVATISDCYNMTDKELDDLATEILEELDYNIIENKIKGKTN